MVYLAELLVVGIPYKPDVARQGVPDVLERLHLAVDVGHLEDLVVEVYGLGIATFLAFFFFLFLMIFGTDRTYLMDCLHFLGDLRVTDLGREQVHVHVGVDAGGVFAEAGEAVVAAKL